MRLILALLFCTLLLPAVAAISGHIPLLALVEQGNETSGAIADLSLEIREGSGRVFLDTFPLTRVATQISMRFAQQVVCAELDIDCSMYDFIYTINASPGIIGGPSAGGAAGVLTASLLKGWQLREDIAMTGTINSGGLIGPVGGLKEKIGAAGAAGVSTVLIPRGARVKAEGNETVNLREVGRTANTSVVEISSLADAVEFFTGKRYGDGIVNISVSEDYLVVMESVATDLCNRAKRLQGRLERANLSGKDGARRELAVNLTRQADALVANRSFYSAASYCFRANLVQKALVYRVEGVTIDEVRNVTDGLRADLSTLSAEVGARPQRTIADVETYLAVRERLDEAEEAIVDAAALENESDAVGARLAYAEERLESAKSWAKFFDLPSRTVSIDEGVLREACQDKLAEAEERYSYVKTIVPEALGAARVSIDSAYDDFENRSFALCVQKASKAKAEADVILSVVGYEVASIPDVIDVKLATVRRSLTHAQAKGLFPLVAYSYYEYASSLREDDQFSALLFSEYALELSNLDIYFGPVTGRARQPSVALWLSGIDPRVLLAVGLLHGFLVGVVIAWFARGRRLRARRRSR